MKNKISEFELLVYFNRLNSIEVNIPKTYAPSWGPGVNKNEFSGFKKFPAIILNLLRSYTEKTKRTTELMMFALWSSVILYETL